MSDDPAVDAVRAILNEEGLEPYMSRQRDLIDRIGPQPEAGPEREDWLRQLREQDNEMDRKNREFAERIVEAVRSAPSG